MMPCVAGGTAGAPAPPAGAVNTLRLTGPMRSAGRPAARAAPPAAPLCPLPICHVHAHAHAHAISTTAAAPGAACPCTLAGFFRKLPPAPFAQGPMRAPCTSASGRAGSMQAEQCEVAGYAVGCKVGVRP